MNFAKSTQRITVLFLALLLSCSGALYGQERAGTNASPQLLVPVGAQYLQGSGAAAGISGIESVLWNPAGLGGGKGEILVMGSRREHLADIGVNFLAAGVRFDKIGTFALHIRNFSIGEIKETTEFNPGGTGSTFTPTFITVGASYGRAVVENIRVGFTANLTHESFANTSATGFTFDAGVQYGQFLGLERLDIGVSVRNIGRSLEYGGSGLLVPASAIGADRSSGQLQILAADAEIPTTVDVSLEYNVWRGLNVAATYKENTFQAPRAQGQLSYNFRDLITVRGAWSQILEDRGELEGPFENRPTFGGTLNLKSVLGVNLSFDYAFVTTKYFENNHILSLRGSF
ncbi:MAG: PorV/PorQ family protein [Salinibacter sp.]